MQMTFWANLRREREWKSERESYRKRGKNLCERQGAFFSVELNMTTSQKEKKVLKKEKEAEEEEE